MAKVYKTNAVVLRKTKLGETDLIVTLLNEEGAQLRAVAKGARKPGSRFGARLEPFSVVEIMCSQGRSLDNVSDVRLLASNAGCRETLEHAAACDLVAEFLEKATQEVPLGSRAFAMTVAAFAEIEQMCEEDTPALAIAHVLKATAMMGLRPAIHECALCGSPLAFAQNFSIEEGGARCDSCVPQASYSDTDENLLDWVDLLLHSTFAELAETEGAPVRELLTFTENWLQVLLGLR